MFFVNFVVSFTVLMYAQLIVNNTVEYGNYMNLGVKGMNVTLTNESWGLSEIVIYVTVGGVEYHTEASVNTNTSYVPKFEGVNERDLTSVNISVYDRIIQGQRQQFIGSVVLNFNSDEFSSKTSTINTLFDTKIRDTRGIIQGKMLLFVEVTLEHSKCDCSTNRECGMIEHICKMCGPTYGPRTVGDGCGGEIPCAERTHDLKSWDSTSPCGRDLDNHGCYLELDKYTCSTDCANTSSNSMPKVKSRVCILKSCEDRRYEGTAIFPCIEDTCFLQPDGSTCSTTCPQHYQENSITIACDPVDCFDRKYSGGRCDASADDDAHWGKCGWVQVNTSRVCTLCVFDDDFNATTGECENFAGCTQRMPNLNYSLTVAPDNTTDNVATEYVCGRNLRGEKCYLDYNRSSCSLDCDSAHTNYVINSSDPSSLACVLLPCSQRKHSRMPPSQSPPPTGVVRYYPCEGNESTPECFLQPDNETCAVSCPVSHVKDATGVCLASNETVPGDDDDGDDGDGSKGGSNITIIVIVVVVVVVVVGIVVIIVAGIVRKYIKRREHERGEGVLNLITVLSDKNRERIRKEKEMEMEKEKEQKGSDAGVKMLWPDAGKQSGEGSDNDE